jgi:hypothetical protein
MFLEAVHWLLKEHYEKKENVREEGFHIIALVNLFHEWSANFNIVKEISQAIISLVVYQA